MTRYEADIAQGHVRLLRYVRDTGNLFFTTSLQNAVRAYSLKDDKLLAPSCEHPSPPTVIALSPDSHWLLSASVAPPTILLNNLLLHTPAVMVRPQCSTAAVVAADFHPQRTNIFLLAFADGACAIYDVAHLVQVSGRGDYQKDPAYSGIGGEISYVKRIHAIASSMPLSDIETGSLGPGIQHINHGVGERGIGIVAAALVPGSRAKAVTVGADGKCCVVNFFTEGKKVGSVMRSWHVHGPATSLALLSSSSKPVLDNTQQSHTNGLKQPRRRVLVAIGRQDGIVLLYDLGGHLFRDRQFSLDGSRIVELEWTSNSARLETGQPDSGLAVPSVVAFRQKRKSVGELPGSIVPTAGIVPVIDGANDEIVVSLLDSLARVEPIQESARQGYVAHPAVSHLDCFNLATQNASHGKDQHTLQNQDMPSDSKKSKSGKLKNSKPSHGNVPPLLQTRLEAPSSSKPLPPQAPLLPPLPPRPIRGKVGDASLSRVEKEKSTTSGAVVDSSQDQHLALDNSSASKGLPRSSRGKRLDVIALNHAANKHEHGASTFTTDEEKIVLPTTLMDTDNNEWTDISASSRRPIRKLNGKPARMEKRKDRKGSSAFRSPSSMVSEASNDIVVDWSPASTHLVVPSGSLLPHRLPEIPPRTAKSRKKTPRKSSLSNDTIVQWSSFKKGHIFAMANKPFVQNSQPLPSSSSISPNNELSPATPTKPDPLTKPSQNPKQQPPHPPPVVVVEVPPSSSLPPSRPPPPPPTTINPAEPREDHSDQLQLQAKIDILREEIALHFRVQKTWIDAQLKGLGEESLRLEEENRRLRREVEDLKAERRKINIG